MEKSFILMAKFLQKQKKIRLDFRQVLQHDFDDRPKSFGDFHRFWVNGEKYLLLRPNC